MVLPRFLDIYLILHFKDLLKIRIGGKLESGQFHNIALSAMWEFVYFGGNSNKMGKSRFSSFWTEISYMTKNHRSEWDENYYFKN